MTHSLTIKYHRAILLLTLYEFISVLFLALTSGGWTGIFYQFFGGLFAAAVLIVVGICLFVRWMVFRDTVFIVSVSWLQSVAIAQIGTLLLNIGDCGDTRGSYFFIGTLITRLIGAHEVCSGAQNSTLVLWAFSLFFLSYLVILLSGLLMCILQTPSMTGHKDSEGKI